MVKLLLERRDINPNRPDNWNQTPLWCATEGGHERVVKLLLERRDVNPNCLDVNGLTLLVSASIKGYEEVVKLLLEREDVYLDCQGKFDRTPFGWARTISSPMNHQARE